MIKRDFEYALELIEGFLKQKRVIDGFKWIHDYSISGWETWLQIEFAFYLSKHESQPEAEREVAFSFDGRKEKERYTLKPDFLIRKKGWTVDSYLAIEIKQDPSAQTCITKMMSDLNKVSKMKESDIDIRSYWALGFFYRADSNKITKIINEKCQDWYYPNYSKTAEIKGTNFMYALI